MLWTRPRQPAKRGANEREISWSAFVVVAACLVGAGSRRNGIMRCDNDCLSHARRPSHVGDGSLYRNVFVLAFGRFAHSRPLKLLRLATDARVIGEELVDFGFRNF